MEIVVRTLAGEEESVSIPNETTRQVLAELLEDVTGIAGHQQRLVVNGVPFRAVGGYVDAPVLFEDGDEVLVMVNRRTRPMAVAEEAMRSPTRNEVMEATRAAALSEEALEAKAAQITASIRELVESLTGVRFGGDDTEVSEDELPELDASLVAMILEMGFSEAAARRALFVNGMDLMNAVNYLTTNAGNEAINAPLSQMEMRKIVSLYGRRPGSNDSGDGSDSDDDFEFNEEAAAGLVDMGFPRSEVEAALRATNNNFQAAASWLLGDRTVAAPPQRRRRIDASNPIVRAVFDNPSIQQRLANPRVVQAFHAMVESPSEAARYMADPEIGPVLLRIHTIIANAGDANGEGGGPGATSQSAAGGFSG